MACCLFGANALPEPILHWCQLNPTEQNFNEIEINILQCSLKKMHLKMLSAQCLPFCSGMLSLLLELHPSSWLLILWWLTNSRSQNSKFKNPEDLTNQLSASLTIFISNSIIKTWLLLSSSSLVFFGWWLRPPTIYDETGAAACNIHCYTVIVVVGW